MRKSAFTDEPMVKTFREADKTNVPAVAFAIDTALSDPGKSWQNGTDESFNGRFRDECLNMEWFTPNQFETGYLSPSTHFEGAESK